MTSIFLLLNREDDIHYEFKRAFELLGYDMWSDDPTDDVAQIVSLFLGMKIRKPSEARKGMIILAPGTTVKFLDDDGNEHILNPSIIMDVLTVLNFFMTLCEKGKSDQYDKDEELDMNTVPEGEEPVWPGFVASEAWLYESRTTLLNGFIGAKVQPTGTKALAQSISLDAFPSDTNDWINWELSTIAKFQSAGIINVLTDAEYANLNPRIDSIAAGLLKAAFANKSSFLDTAFLSEDGDLVGSGYKIWQKLRGFYEYPGLIRCTLEDYQSTFEDLKHKQDGNFMRFAKKFMSLRNIIIHLQVKAEAADMDDITPIKNWKGIFLNKISGDLNISAIVTLLKKDDKKELWECICDVNAHLANIKQKEGDKKSDKAKGKKQGNDEEEDKPKESEKEPAPQKGPTIVQHLYNMKNQSKDDEKKKIIQSLIDETRQSSGGKEKKRKSYGKGKPSNEPGPKRRRRNSDNKAHEVDMDPGDDGDRSMTGAEASSIFG